MVLGFIRHQYRQYRIMKEVKVLQKKFEEMETDIREMKGSELKAKYGNPTRAWALMRWEQHKLRQKAKEAGII